MGKRKNRKPRGCENNILNVFTNILEKKPKLDLNNPQQLLTNNKSQITQYNDNKTNTATESPFIIDLTEDQAPWPPLPRTDIPQLQELKSGIVQFCVTCPSKAANINTKTYNQLHNVTITGQGKAKTITNQGTTKATKSNIPESTFIKVNVLNKTVTNTNQGKIKAITNQGTTQNTNPNIPTPLIKNPNTTFTNTNQGKINTNIKQETTQTTDPNIPKPQIINPNTTFTNVNQGKINTIIKQETIQKKKQKKRKAQFKKCNTSFTNTNQEKINAITNQGTTQTTDQNIPKPQIINPNTTFTLTNQGKINTIIKQETTQTTDTKIPKQQIINPNTTFANTNQGKINTIIKQETTHTTEPNIPKPQIINSNTTFTNTNQGKINTIIKQETTQTKKRKKRKPRFKKSNTTFINTNQDKIYPIANQGTTQTTNPNVPKLPVEKPKTSVTNINQMKIDTIINQVPFKTKEPNKPKPQFKKSNTTFTNTNQGKFNTNTNQGATQTTNPNIPKPPVTKPNTNVTNNNQMKIDTITNQWKGQNRAPKPNSVRPIETQTNIKADRVEKETITGNMTEESRKRMQNILKFDLPNWVIPNRSQPDTPITQPTTSKDSNLYSPTKDIQWHNKEDMEVEGDNEEWDSNPDPGDLSDDHPEIGNKRVSAFTRLGPISQPKKPKLTINLLFSKEKAFREVVDKDIKEEQCLPVPQRKYIVNSTDEIVKKFLPLWPHMKFTKEKPIELKDLEQQWYFDSTWIKVYVKSYPSHFSKENVLDIVCEVIKDKNFIPCFVEFTERECSFLVIRCQNACSQLRAMGMTIVKGNVKLNISLCKTSKSLSNLDFIPRLILRKRLSLVYDMEKTLDLRNFCMGRDISHFIYYPLNFPTNQSDLMQIQNMVSWNMLRELNLSNNRLTTIAGFRLHVTTPNLHILDLSDNCIEKFGELIECRGLLLRSLILEGNPLCADFFNPEEYVEVSKLLFPTLTTLDGVKIHCRSELPTTKRNYSPVNAKEIAEKFLEVYFRLLDSKPPDRTLMNELYDEDAILSITCTTKLRRHHCFPSMSNMCFRLRDIRAGKTDCIEGADKISKYMSKWPTVQHDPHTFQVDVLFHNDTTTIIQIVGLLKLISESLAEEEPLIMFSRTVVLNGRNEHYHIHNELINFDLPTPEFADAAFKVTMLHQKYTTLKFVKEPNEDLQKDLIKIFMKLTKSSQERSEECLQKKNWDFCLALEYFIKLLKLQI